MTTAAKARALREEEDEARRKELCKEIVSLRAGDSFKGVIIPENVPEDTLRQFVEFANSLPYNAIVSGASASFTDLLRNNKERYVFHRFSEFYYGRRILLYPSNASLLRFVSWLDMLTPDYLSRVPPHYYLLCHQVSQLAKFLSYQRNDPQKADLSRFREDLCAIGWRFERYVERLEDLSMLSNLFAGILSHIKFPRLFETSCYANDNTRTRTLLAKRQKDPQLDILAGILYLYTGFMFSCGRFKPGHVVRVFNVQPNSAIHDMLIELHQLYLETRDTTAANIIISTPNPDQGREEPQNIPMSALFVEFGSPMRFRIGSSLPVVIDE